MAAVTAMELPDSLNGRIEAFRHRGHVPAYRDGLFGPTSWQAVFVGQGIVPRTGDRLADAMPAELLKQRLDGFAASVAQGIAGAPTHADFVARYCPAAPL